MGWNAVGKVGVMAIELAVKLSDLVGETDWNIARNDVPEVPAQAKRFEYPDGHRDVVYDYEDQRWRFRAGKLIGYLVYGGKPRRPIALWGGNY
jgi:hypothetical protein